MKLEQEKTARDISGLEYDWLCSDAGGYVGLFSTAGGGFAPAPFLKDVQRHDDAIERLLAAPPTTRAVFFPELAAGTVNTWLLVAERGVFAYDSDPNGGPYRLVAAPVAAQPLQNLSPMVADVARSIRLTVRFSSHPIVSEADIRDLSSG